MNTLWPWIALALLGAYHGLNPGMGWLFAVARGLQEGSRAVVLGSFAPIALGHMASVAMVVALVVLAQPFVDPAALRLAGALALLAFGVYKLLIRAHPRWVGMRVRPRELALWSFLMATAHGAGLMLVPVLAAAQANNIVICTLGNPALEARLTSLASLALHTLAMFVVMVAVALLVYEKLGLAVLRRAWFNLDLLWAWSLILVGALSLPWS